MWLRLKAWRSAEVYYERHDKPTARAVGREVLIDTREIAFVESVESNAIIHMKHDQVLYTEVPINEFWSALDYCDRAYDMRYCSNTETT